VAVAQSEWERPKTDPFAPTVTCMESVEEPAIFTARDAPQSDAAPSPAETPEGAPESAQAASGPRETQPFGSGVHPTRPREPETVHPIDTADYVAPPSIPGSSQDFAVVELDDEPTPGLEPTPVTSVEPPLDLVGFTASSELEALDRLADEPDPHRMPTARQLDRMEQSTGPTDVNSFVDRSDSEDLEETVAFVPQPRRRLGIWVAVGLVAVICGVLALFLLTSNVLRSPDGEEPEAAPETPAVSDEAPATAPGEAAEPHSPEPAADEEPEPAEEQAAEEEETEAEPEDEEAAAGTQPGATRLVLDSDPQRAAVYRGDTPLCVTPCDLDIDAPGGAERIRLVREGYDTASIMVVLSPGQEVRRVVKLDPVSRPAQRAGAKSPKPRARPSGAAPVTAPRISPKPAAAAEPAPSPAPAAAPEPAAPPTSAASKKRGPRDLRKVRLEAPARVKSPGTPAGEAPPTAPSTEAAPEPPQGSESGAAAEEEKPSPKKVKRKRSRKAKVRLLDPGTDGP
jgi:hypothetical protein